MRLPGFLYGLALAAGAATTIMPIPGLAADPGTDAIKACVKPGQSVKTGIMSGQDATAMIQCNGGSGAGSSIKFYLNFGPQNGGTIYAGEVVGGSHMNVFFSGGYAYVTSALHSSDIKDSSACEQCYTLMLVQRLSTREHFESPGPLLVDNGIDIIRLGPSEDYKREARQAYYKATQIFDNRDLRSRDLVKSGK